MRRERKFAAFSLAFLGVTLSCFLLSLATLCWFTGGNSLSKDVSGSLLRSYFHSGSGTAEDPFTITRPIHYHNLAYLNDFLDGFSEKGYYVEVGYDLDGDEALEVYEYDDEGAATGNYSETTLNMKGSYDGGLPPIGTPEEPWIGSFEGNSFAIDSLKVVSAFTDDNGTTHGFSDLGAFGYVGERSSSDNSLSISNLYFSNLTIDVNDSDPAEGSATGHTAHSGQTYLGYLVGHLHNASQVSGCYVNDSEMVGTVSSGATDKSNYGTYGYVEYDTEGGAIADGGGYSFTFNPASMYAAFESIVGTYGKYGFLTRDRSTDIPYSSSVTLNDRLVPGQSLDRPITVSDAYFLYGAHPGSSSDKSLASFSLNQLGWAASSSDAPSYLTDQEAITNTGYVRENIDIVGGLYFQSDSLAMEGFGDGVPDAPEIGNSWYADLVSDGLILYIRNTGQSSLGSITFTCTPGTDYNNNLTLPVFNKGGDASNCVAFTAIGTQTISGSVYTEAIALTDANVRQACYCGIDSDGKIVATYDTSGNAGTGSSEDSIDYFVMVLGVSSGGCFVNKIEFEYSSAKGGGGSAFGSVEYRTRPETAANVIFQWYADFAAGAYISIKVSYANNVYAMTATISLATEFTFHLYDSGYSLTVNGAAVEALSSGTVYAVAANSA